MGAIWSTEAKFAAWRQVELAVLQAREKMCQLEHGTWAWVKDHTWMDAAVAEAIELRDEAIGHDLNAFLDVMRAQMNLGEERFNALLALKDEAFQEALDQALKLKSDPRVAHFHDGMTSYDTEEPAMALLLKQACAVILKRLIAIHAALAMLAKTHRGVVMMGRTHGQHAQPVTFGVKILNLYEMADRALKRFHAATDEACVMKLSGAVGMYGTLSPKVEEATAAILGIPFAPVATQIVALDRRGHLVNTLAEIAAVVEKIALDLWLLSQTEVAEVREPFGKRQKGSSAMPHKKNPIVCEQSEGLPRLIRAYAGALLENVATPHERDISASSVEREAVPSSFAYTDHMLGRMTKVLEGLEVFPDRMRENIALSRGTFASQRVEMLLKQRGVAPELAYRIVQDQCFVAMKTGEPLPDLLLTYPDLKDLRLADDPDFHACFDPRTWVSQEDAIYARMGL